MTFALLPEWRSSFIKTKTTLLNTSCGRYLVWSGLVSWNVQTTEMLTKISQSLLSGSLDNSRVTVKTKGSHLYLKHNLLVTAKLSGQYTVYKLPVHQVLMSNNTQTAGTGLRNYTLAAFKYTWLFPVLKLTASWAVYAGWCMDRGRKKGVKTVKARFIVNASTAFFF